MKKFLLPLFIFFLLGVPSIGIAQKPPSQPTNNSIEKKGCDPTAEQQAIERRKIYSHFQEMVEISKNPSAVLALSQKLEQMQSIYRASGLGELSYISSALVRMGIQLRLQGRTDLALEMVNAALEFWSSDIDAYGLKMRLQLDSGLVSGLPSAIWTWVQQTSKQMGEFWRAFFVFHYLFIWFWVVVGLLALVWILNWTLAYYRLWCHDFAEIMSSLPSFVSLILGAAIPLLPLILGQGLIWSLMILLVLIWPYTSRPEKYIVALGAGAMMALPSIANYTSAAASLYDQKMAHILTYNGEGEEWNESVWNDLSNIADDPGRRRDPIPLFLLGNFYYQSHCYFDAADRYQQAEAVDQSFAKAINNLGNSLYQQGNADGAIVKYQQAKKMDDTMCSPLINLNLAFNEKFEFDAAAAELSEAKSLCPAFVSKVVGNDVSRADKHDIVIQEKLDATSYLWDIFYESVEGEQLLVEDLWPKELLGVELSSLLFASLALLAGLLLRSNISKTANQTRYCLKCAQPACPKCQLPQTSELYCGQCTRLFILRSGIDAQVQRDGIARTNRLIQNSIVRAKICNLILPGSGHYLFGRHAIGLVLLTAWAFVLGLGLRPGLEIFSYLDVVYDPIQLLNSLLIILGAVVWSLANLFIPLYE